MKRRSAKQMSLPGRKERARVRSRKGRNEVREVCIEDATRYFRRTIARCSNGEDLASSEKLKQGRGCERRIHNWGGVSVRVVVSRVLSGPADPCVRACREQNIARCVPTGEMIVCVCFFSPNQRRHDKGEGGTRCCSLTRGVLGLAALPLLRWV